MDNSREVVPQGAGSAKAGETVARLRQRKEGENLISPTVDQTSRGYSPIPKPPAGEPISGAKSGNASVLTSVGSRSQSSELSAKNKPTAESAKEVIARAQSGINLNSNDTGNLNNLEKALNDAREHHFSDKGGDK